MAPAGPVYQAGTLSGNPLAMAAGMAAISELKKTNPYPVLEERAQRLVQGVKAAAENTGIPMQAVTCGSMFGMFFSDSPVKNFSDAKAADGEAFKKFFHAMLDRGVYLAPSSFEAGFLSIAHDDSVIDETITAAKSTFSEW
jgi:glutamate-1-semialdehyde 2,1-aminomutase